MKFIAIVLSLFFLVSQAKATIDTTEICLSSDHQSTTLPDKKYFEQIESQGHYTLLGTYEETEGESPHKISVLLLNLKTAETKELVNEPVPDKKIGNSFLLYYGFSKDASLTWVYNSLNHTLKIWNLPEGTEVTIPFTEGHVLGMKMQEDGLTLGSFEIIWPPPEAIEEFPLMEFFNYFNTHAKAVFRTVNLRTLHQTQKIIPEIGAKALCSGWNLSEDHFFFTDKDGSLHQFFLITEEEPVKIFDPIEGFTFFNNEFHPKKNVELSDDLFAMLWVIGAAYDRRSCFPNAPDFSLFLIPNSKGDGYILRVPKEGKEFLLPLSAFPDISDKKHISSSHYPENFELSHLHKKGMTDYIKDLKFPSFNTKFFLQPQSQLIFPEDPEIGRDSRFTIESDNQKPHSRETSSKTTIPGEEGFFNLPSVSHRRSPQISSERFRKMVFRYEGEADRLEERAYELYENGFYEKADGFERRAYGLYDRVEELEERVDTLYERTREFRSKVYELRDSEKTPSLRSLWRYIRYPFIINPHYDEGNMRVYHIPSEQFHTIHTGYMEDFRWEKNGRFSFETWETNGGQRVLQAWIHPFDPNRRTSLFEWDREEVCNFSIHEENNQAFVNTIQGDFFVFHLETGQMVRHFVEGCFPRMKPISQTKFLFYKYDENRDSNEEIKIKTFNEQCVEPSQIALDGIQSTLVRLEQAGNPTENSLFSLLIGVLEQEEAAKGHPKLVIKVLWNVLLHSPSLYFSLTRRYPFLETLSPPDMAFDFKANKPYLDGVLSLLKLTVSEARESRLSEWNFLHPLQPLLKLLPATERNFYMEKITISLTNGITREIPLFRDVFQSKLYYTANGHVKKLFGLTRKPVSDITLARRKREYMENEAVVIRAERTDRGVEYRYRDRGRRVTLDRRREVIRVEDGDRDRRVTRRRVRYRGRGRFRNMEVRRSPTRAENRDRDRDVEIRGNPPRAENRDMDSDRDIDIDINRDGDNRSGIRRRGTRVVRGEFREVTPMEQSDSNQEEKEKTLNAFTTVILASDPIEGYPSIPTDFGIHYAVVKEASREIKKSEPGTILLDKVVQWKVLKGQNYRAQIKVSVKQERGVRELILSSGPDYSAVWQDNRMVGAVIVGSSLRGFTRNLLEKYFSYFKEQGFQFSGAETEDLKGFLLERISECEIDYFLKESHSGGDERNLFRIDKKNHIIRGVFVDEGGREEVIYLMFPQAFRHEKGLKTDLLSYEELRQAINLRKANNCGQVTYFSTGCWSDRKALYEVEAVNSPLFLNIPSTDTSGTFQNKEKSAIRALLNSFRKGLDFDGFREALKDKDPYIFPDEPQYQERIFDRIQIPLDIHMVLEQKDKETWKKVAPDEAL